MFHQTLLSHPFLPQEQEFVTGFSTRPQQTHMNYARINYSGKKRNCSMDKGVTNKPVRILGYA